MKTVRAIAAAIGLLFAAHLGAASASAATEVGNDCVGNAVDVDVTMVQRSSASARPLSVPAAGVLTRWSVEVINYPGAVLHSLKVLRPMATSQFRAVAEAYARVRSGLNSFEARLPVQKGDRFGLGGTGEIFYCEGLSASEELWKGGFDLPLGNQGFFVTDPAAGVPLVATVEPDADGDGYGDESQDGCPQSAAFQGPCPTADLDLIALRRRGSVLLLVTSSSETPVRVSAFARIPGKRAPKRKRARVSARAKLPTQTKTVAPGKFVRFNLRYTKRLRTALSGLPRSKSLTLRITSSATDVAGRVTTKRLSLKLRGQRRT
ncbi:MAG TPA: hypothetical protein VFZ41_04080 [Solirubrobacterales bacterium]